MVATQADNRPWIDLLLRKSKVVREGERALSIRAQEERGRKWAAENGYRVRKVWKENLSAWSDVRRPKMDAALSAVLLGEVPALWCYALDRFSRKGAEAVVPILGKARVIFDYERLDSMDERDRRWIIDRAENAREYSQRLSYNVRTTKTRQRNEGRWLAKAPFGLVADKSTRKLNPDVENLPGKNYSPWDIVLRMFRSVAKGTSARGLAKIMNAEGILSATGKHWRVDSICKILNHPVYEGWLTVCPSEGRTRAAAVAYLNDAGEPVRCVEVAVLPRMISAELASQARRSLQGHIMWDRTPKDGCAKHVLTGLTRCASCEYSMTLGGNSYGCQLKRSGAPCIAPASVMRKNIEDYVVDAWLARLENADEEDPLLSTIASRWTTLSQPQETQQATDAVAELKAAEAQLDKFHSDDASDFYAGASAKYRMPAKRKAEDRLTKAQEQVAALSVGRVDISFLLNGEARGAWEAASSGLRRDLLGLAIDRVTVTKGPGRGYRFNGPERVSITWAQEPEGDQEEATADQFAQAA